MLLLTLIACNPWSFPDDAEKYVDDQPWDPNVVAAEDGVYVRLPLAGDLVRIAPDGTWATVDLDGASPDRVIASEDGTTVLVYASWPICEDDDPKIRYVRDCDDEDLDERTELRIYKGGELKGVVDNVPSAFNAVAFSEDGNYAAAFLDFSTAGEIDVGSVLNLTEAIFLDLGAGTGTSVSIGFAAESILFTSEGDAVVLSRSEVALVRHEESAWDVAVSFPLTLDPDQEISPDDVELLTYENAEGELTDYALVSVAGLSDLYVLDLTHEYIDVVDLRAVPSDLLVDEETGQTVIVYASLSEVDLLDHDLFEVTTIDVDEPSTHAVPAGDVALLYNDGGTYHDVYLFDPTTGEAVEFRAENPVMEMKLTSDGGLAVATLSQESLYGDFYDQYYGLGIFDLVEQDDPISLALGGAPVGFELLENDAGAYALLLLEGVDELLQVDLRNGTHFPFALEEPPLGIAAMPGGQFVVTHEAALGLLTFVDPAQLDPDDPEAAVVTVAGFATAGLLGDRELPRRQEEE